MLIVTDCLSLIEKLSSKRAKTDREAELYEAVGALAQKALQPLRLVVREQPDHVVMVVLRRLLVARGDVKVHVAVEDGAEVLVQQQWLGLGSWWSGDRVN